MRQQRLLARAAGTARYAFHWGWNLCKRLLNAGKPVPHAAEPHRLWNAEKPQRSWIYGVSKCCGQRVWDVASGTLRRTLRWQSLPLLWADFSPDGERIVTTGYMLGPGGTSHGDVRFWNAGNGELLSVLDPGTDSVFSLLFTRDGNALIGATADGRLLVWDTATWGPWGLRQRLAAHGGLTNRLALSRDGDTLASASVDGTVKLWRRDGVGGS